MKSIWTDVKMAVACVQFAPFEYSKHVESLVDFLIDASEQVHDKKIVMYRDPNMPLDMRRSAIAQIVKDSPEGFTHLFMYDTDMEVKLSHIERLLSWNLPAVSGTYFMGGMGNGAEFPCVASRNGHYITRNEIAEAARLNALVEVTGSGCGCLLVTTDALRKVGDPAFKDDWKVSGNVTHMKGEDVYFAEQLALAGIKMYMDPKVIPLHFKELCVGFDIYDSHNHKFYTPNQAGG